MASSPALYLTTAALIFSSSALISGFLVDRIISSTNACRYSSWKTSFERGTMVLM